MAYFEIITSEKAQKIGQHRSGETKYFQEVLFGNEKESIENQLNNSSAKFVLFGISEDLGVRANYGNPGANHTWEVVLKTLLNIQSNRFTKPTKTLVLGHFNFESLYRKKIDTNNVSTLRETVKIIDSEVAHLVQLIVQNGKIPIAIGGGHNNAYGLIKGSSLALKAKINAINFDAHTDLRALEGRHSGNGFSYAIEDGFLDRYFVLGMHENYTSETILNQIDNSKNIQYVTYESIETRREIGYIEALNQGQQFVINNPFGIEIDCDAIAHCPSSAMSPTGFSAAKARQFVVEMGKHSTATYLHICEAAPSISSNQLEYNIGKMITALITDFIRVRV